jgi:PAS domain S-box-containing protein
MRIPLFVSWRESFRTKIFAIFALFIVVICCSFTVFFIWHESRSHTEKLLTEGKLLSKILVYNSRLAVFAENRTMLKDVIAGVMPHEHVLAVCIYTPDGRELIEEVKSGHGVRAHGDIRDRITRAGKQSSTMYFPEADRIELITPIFSETPARSAEALYFDEKPSPQQLTVIGVARIVLDKGELNERIRKLVATGVALGALFLLLGSISAFFIIKSVTTPLNKLVEGANALGRGELSRRVVVETRDELGQVAIAFNEMVDSLERRESEKQQLQEQLRLAQKLEAKEEWERTFDTVPDLVAILDREFRIVRVNKALAERLGCTKEELVGRLCSDLLRGAEALADCYPLCAGGGAYTAEVYEERLASHFWVTVSPLRRNDGGVAGVVYVARDITVRKAAEEEKKMIQAKLVQTNKMTSIGLLVSGLAHDVNNPNGAIMLAAHLLARSWKDILPILDNHLDAEGDFSVGGHKYSQVRDNLSYHIDGIMENSRRIEGIINNLKDFVRKGKANLTIATDVNEVVAVSASILNSHIKRQTSRFKLELAERLPSIKGNPQQLEQVVINLILNALQALPDKKRGVRVVTSADTVNGFVIIAVHDEGCGMSHEVRNRIFEPFFSTKIDRGGTGLGLAISNFIVKEHNGTLEFISEPGKGTTALVKLPLEVTARVSNNGSHSNELKIEETP